MNDRAQKLANQALYGLIDSLSAGQSEALKTYLRTMSRFYRYSWFNSMLIGLQRPEATHVAGFRRWLDMGRCVKEGEKGIMILAPVTYRPKRDDNEVKDETTQEVRIRAEGFTVAWVFDIEQTEGRPLPMIGERSGDPGHYAQRLLEFAHRRSIIVSLVDDLGGAHGRSKGGSIELLSRLSPVEQFGVLAHEIAHELLHQGSNWGTKPRVIRETEAEAVAFVICEAVGIDNGTASQDYIQLYQGDGKLLMASLASIQKAASMILKEILD